MSVNAALMDHEEREREKACCRYCGEPAWDCGCGDELRDRERDDAREER